MPPKDLFEGLPGPATKSTFFLHSSPRCRESGFQMSSEERQITSTKVFSVSAPWAMNSSIYRLFTKIKTVISAAELFSVAQVESVAFFSKKETLWEEIFFFFSCPAANKITNAFCVHEGREVHQNLETFEAVWAAALNKDNVGKPEIKWPHCDHYWKRIQCLDGPQPSSVWPRVEYALL